MPCGQQVSRLWQRRRIRLHDGAARCRTVPDFGLAQREQVPLVFATRGLSCDDAMVAQPHRAASIAAMSIFLISSSSLRRRAWRSHFGSLHHPQAFSSPPLLMMASQ